MRHIGYLGVIAVMLLPSMSVAADVPAPLNEIALEAPLFDWTGFYVGVQAGGAWGDVRVDDYNCIKIDDCDGPGNRYFVEADVSGWKGGAHVGYNQQFGTFVLGAESDINFSTVSGAGPFRFYDLSEDETFDGRSGETSSFAMLWEGSTRLKAGLAIDRLMPYVTGGVAYGQAEVDDHRIFGPDEDTRELDFSHSINLIGYTVGAGAAYAVTDQIIVRGEARFTKYGDVISGDILPGDSEILQISGPSTVSLEGGISFKF